MDGWMVATFKVTHPVHKCTKITYKRHVAVAGAHLYKIKGEDETDGAKVIRMTNETTTQERERESNSNQKKKNDNIMGKTPYGTCHTSQVRTI